MTQKLDRLDEAIDRAVREMLDVEPPADLRVRVIAQLAASGTQLPASGSFFPLVASAFRRNRVVFATAAALIVLAVFVARRSEPVPPSSVRAADVYLAPGAAPAVRSPEVASPPAPRSVVASVRPPSRALDTRQVAAADVRDSAPQIAPLRRITPISAAPIEQERIAPAEMEMHPLNAITEIQIAPLTPPDRRN